MLPIPRNDSTPPRIAAGYCQCGCGQRTKPAQKTSRRLGWVQGRPLRFLGNHGNGRRPMPLRERFWSKVNKSGPIVRAELGRCWEWTGYKLKGYGRITAGPRSLHVLYAHRVAYTLYVGAIPKELHVLHKCDHPPCVNPAHLFLGTEADNSTDKVRKGRSASGERHPQARLTAKQVRQIRALVASGAKRKDVARQFHVHYMTVVFIVTGKTWTRV